MRQLQADFLLRTYSIILLDEAHERSLNTDLLLGKQWLLLFEGSKEHEDCFHKVGRSAEICA
jgi:ATP-dependent RNA helicase DHX37/DHR1